jgi:hypothetical protein
MDVPAHKCIHLATPRGGRWPSLGPGTIQSEEEQRKRLVVQERG